MKLPEDFEYTFPPLRRAFDAGKAQGEKDRDESVRRGKEQGEALGKARAVVRLLERRRILVPDASRERILGCADLELLSCWFDRAVEASSVEEVLEG